MVAALAGWPTAPAVAQESNVVPTLVSFSGTLTDLDHKPLAGIAGVTFCIYKDQQGGTPLWMETQNVQLDREGKYAVQLGSTKSHGLPADLFASGEARWLGVQAQGQPEQPRVMLLSVPYALKAADAQTVGGLPPSAFVLAAPRASSSSITYSQADPAILAGPTGTGTTDFVPLWTSGTNLGNSILFQGSNYINIGGALQFPALGTATASTAYSSQPLDMFASVYNSSLAVAVPQHFRWQAEAVSNNTSSASGKVDLLYGSGTAAPTETGLSINSKGILTFASGQTLPSVAGNETVSGNVSASQIISTVAQGTAPLKLTSTTQVANLNASYLGGIAATGVAKIGANTFTGNQVINGNLGIGTTSPTSPLTIVGNSGASGSGSANFWRSDLGGNHSLIQYGGTGDWYIRSALSAGKVILQDTGGNVGIGTSSPAQLLEVNGNIQVDGLLAVGTAESNCSAAAVCAQAINGSNSNGALGVKATGGNANQNGVYHGGDGLDAQGGNGGGCDVNQNCGTGGAGVRAMGGSGQAEKPAGGGPGAGGVFVGGSSPCFGNGCGGDGIDAYAGIGQFNNPDGFAGNFSGDVRITGSLYTSAKNIKIDHPLDPANKYLVHASIESSEMMNVYSGNVTTDAQGEATVQLPGWFEALNRDFRYQLTVIGRFAQAIVARKIENHQFTIRTNAPSVEVSWQVTGVRQDAYAQAHPLVVEEEKPARLQGFYIHPELHGAPPEKQIEWARHPELMKWLKEQRERQGARTAAAKAR
jgi:hypothetical protein